MAAHVEQIGPRTWKCVESDPYGQYAFIYVILGRDKCVLVDTGCGTCDLAAVVRRLNPAGLPVVVVCTHVHFDVRALPLLHVSPVGPLTSASRSTSAPRTSSPDAACT